MYRDKRYRCLHSQQQCGADDRLHSRRFSGSGRRVKGNAECDSKRLSSTASSAQPLCRLLLPTYLHVTNSGMQTLTLKGLAKRKTMYHRGQFLKSRRRIVVFNKGTTPGEFTISLKPIRINVRRPVFEPNPSQQGLKHNEAQFLIRRVWCRSA